MNDQTDGRTESDSSGDVAIASDGPPKPAGRSSAPSPAALIPATAAFVRSGFQSVITAINNLIKDSAITNQNRAKQTEEVKTLVEQSGAIDAQSHQRTEQAIAELRLVITATQQQLEQVSAREQQARETAAATTQALASSVAQVGEQFRSVTGMIERLQSSMGWLEAAHAGIAQREEILAAALASLEAGQRQANEQEGKWAQTAASVQSSLHQLESSVAGQERELLALQQSLTTSLANQAQAQRDVTAMIQKQTAMLDTQSAQQAKSIQRITTLICVASVVILAAIAAAAYWLKP